jgi:hypothetical protein
MQEIRIKGVKPQVHREIKNIAKNSGVTISTLLKSHLPKIIEQYPDKYRQEYQD